MACCGQKRAQVTGSAGGGAGKTSAVARALSNFVLYQYDGLTAMTVTGPVSGSKYRFAAPGARVQIDARDVASMAALPHLRRVSATATHGA